MKAWTPDARDRVVWPGPSVVAVLCVLCVSVVSVFAAEGDQRWALVIGVDKCKAMGELKVCCADARAMKALLEKVGYSADHVNLLADDSQQMTDWPTIGNIRRGVKSIADVAERGDTILLFYSGHGVTRGEEGYLVPTDGDRENAISLNWIKEQLAGSKASQKILILDACHAGAAKGVDGIRSDLRLGESTVMLLSCEQGQVSWPDEQKGHSVFTQYLLEGLAGEAAGSDGKVTDKEIHDYVSRKVKAWTFSNKKPAQTPVVAGQMQGEVVLATRPQVKIDVGSLGKGEAGAKQEVPAWAKVSQEQVAAAQKAGIAIAHDLDLGGGVKMKLVLIPSGEFMMGSPANEEGHQDDEGPQHRVRITKPFYMGVCEVTKAQFGAFVNASGYRTEAETGAGAYGWTGTTWEKRKEFNWKNVGFTQGQDHPVVCVSWNDAQAFCKWASQKAGMTVRLPTEAEWEYACRAGATTRFSFGDSDAELFRYANYADANTNFNWSDKAHNDGFANTAPVGSFKPNAWGLYDMHGNVWEWCQDWFGNYPTGAVDDPTGPTTGAARVVRGGSWYLNPNYARSANRIYLNPTYAYLNNGFRVVVAGE